MSATLPTPGTVYIGGPAIEPAWLRGRRIIVDRIPTNRDFAEFMSLRHVADTDIELRKGNPMPVINRDPSRPLFIEVHVLARGRIEYEQVNLDKWDATVVAPLAPFVAE